MNYEVDKEVWIEESNEHFGTLRSPGKITRLESNYVEVVYQREATEEWDELFKDGKYKFPITQKFYFDEEVKLPIYENKIVVNKKQQVKETYVLPNRATERVRIEYQEGRMVQEHNVIPQEVYSNFFKPNFLLMKSLDDELSKIKNEKSEKFIELKAQFIELKKLLNEETGMDFVTSESPIYLAKDNGGFLHLPPQQGNTSRIKVTTIQNGKISF